jgi:hypothetical protein
MALQLTNGGVIVLKFDSMPVEIATAQDLLYLQAVGLF